MIIDNFKIFAVLIHLCFSGLLIAQDDDTRFSESEFKIQDRFVKAKLLVVSGKKAEAIKLLDSLRRESPTNATLYYELARLHFENKDYNLTESNLSNAVKIEPNNVWIRNFEVTYYKEIGRNDDAIKTLHHLCFLQPKNAEYYDRIIQLQIKKGVLNDALITLDNKEKNVGWSVSNVLKRAEILDNANRLSEAVDVLKVLISKFPKETKYLKLITNMLHSNDRIAESEPYLRQILEIDSNDNDAKLGLILLDKKNSDGDGFLVTLYPLINNPDAPIDLKIKELLPFVKKHASTGDTILGKQLTDICDKLVISHPNEAKAHAIYADILKNSGNTTAAIRQYEKTLTLNKNIFAVWEQLMYCLEDVENYIQLALTANEAIEFFPNQAITYYFAGKALVSERDYKKALSLLDEAAIISAGNPNIESRVASTKALIAYAQQDFKKATELADQALLISQDKNADAYEIKGDIALAGKDVKSAVQFWNKALKLGGKTNRLNQKLSTVKNN
jgi:tetratricopeptide (TPR) repeat protein